MFERVLVPLDGSPLAEAALAPALEIARKFGSELVLLHVLAASPSEDESQWERGHAEHYLNAIRDNLQADHVRVRLQIAAGDAGREIISSALGEGVSLIAMSTHGKTGRRTLGPGSVASRVLAESHVAVLFAKPTQYRPA